MITASGLINCLGRVFGVHRLRSTTAFWKWWCCSSSPLDGLLGKFLARKRSTAVDSVNIWGADESGNALMVRVARRHDRIAELWIYLKLASGEEYQAPVLPDLQIFNTDGESFSAKGLKLEVLEPLQRWRLSFNGTLRKGLKKKYHPDEDDETIPVQFNFMWHPMYSYSAYPQDFNPKLTATCLAKRQWNKDFFFNRKQTTLEWHEQWGQMQGTLTIDEKPFTVVLTGSKIREHGILDWKTINKKLVIRAFDSIGTAIDLYAESDANGQLNVYHGEVAPPSGKQLYSVSTCCLGSADDRFSEGKEKEVEIDLIADDRKFHLKLDTTDSGFQFYAGKDWECQGHCKLIGLEVNGKRGFGLIEMYKKYDQGSPVPPSESIPHLSETGSKTD